jgi:hypothetical protein
MNNDKIVFDEKGKKFYKDKHGVCTAKGFKEIFNCREFDLGSVMGLADCIHKRHTACTKEVKNE